jgi:hypothetical protein
VFGVWAERASRIPCESRINFVRWESVTLGSRKLLWTTSFRIAVVALEPTADNSHAIHVRLAGEGAELEQRPSWNRHAGVSADVGCLSNLREQEREYLQAGVGLTSRAPPSRPDAFVNREN